MSIPAVSGIDLIVEADVGRVTINVPDRSNALTLAMTRAITDAIIDLANRAAIRVIVVTGEGTAFSAGTDLADDSGVVERAEAYLDLYRTITEAPVPVIARVNGHMYGGAIGIVASCDLSVMAAEGTYGVPEPQLGLVATSTAVPLLRRVRRTDAAEMLLTGRRYSASHALAIGLVNLTVPADALDYAVATYVDEIRRGGPQALYECKKLLWRLDQFDERAAAGWMIAVTSQIAGSAEAREGSQARQERRPPVWTRSAPD
jgi:enoyl-CoA hydratase/carnithine racemase